MTKVVNLLKEPYDVYCGRPGKGKSGEWGNRHVIGFCKICNVTHDRDGCIDAFKKDFDDRIENESGFHEKVMGLKGKRLGCFCKRPGFEVRCHCDIYKEYIEAQD